MQQNGLYASPRVVNDPAECLFYHTTEIPGHGLIRGEWDLRDDVDAYLGGVGFKGKRVLEVGTASGFLCFEMERRGADVVAYDLSEDHLPDIVPFAGMDMNRIAENARAGARRLNNSWWLNHRARSSKARVVYGTVYNIPEQIGAVDIVTFGSVLPHLRDPFLAMAQGCRLAKETVLVTDVVSRRHLPLYWLSKLGIGGKAFLPKAAREEALLSWWVLTPEMVRRSIAVLGFEDAKITYHSAMRTGRRVQLFTVVGRRTQGAPVVA